MNRYKSDPPGRLYRSRSGVLFGVCQGIADYFNFSVSWLRFFIVIMLLISGVWPILGIYIVAALIIKPEPVQNISSDDEQEFYESYVHSRQRAVGRLKRRFENLERRIHRIEDTVTSREFDWDRRMKG